MTQTYQAQENEHLAIVEDNEGENRRWLSPTQKYLHLLAGFVIAALAVTFCFHKLGLPSIWFDEAFSVELARQPLPRLLQLIFGPEPNMELYYLLLHFWLQLTGLFGLHQTEFIVRFPSAVCAVCSAVIVFLIGRRYIGLIGGFLAGALFVLNYLQLVYAQQTRAYALQTMLICIAMYALLNALNRETHSRRWWICYTLVTVLSVYAHLFSLLVVMGQVLALAGLLLLPNTWRQSARRQWKAMLLSFITLGILVIPLIIVSRHGSKTGWLPVPHLSDIYHLFLTVSGNDKKYFIIVVACIFVGIVLSAGSYVVQYQSRVRQTVERQSSAVKDLFAQQQLLPLIWVLLCWLIIPIIVSFIVSQGATRLFSSRYLVVIVPAVFLLVGAGVSSLKNRGVQVLLVIELIFLAYMTVPQYYRSAQVEDWNSASRWLMQHYHKQDGLVCYDNIQGCQISMEYYLHAYPSSDAHFTDDSPGAFSWEKYNFDDAPKALDTSALALYGAQHPHLFFITARLSSDAAVAHVHQTEQWLDQHFRFTDQIITPTVTIRLYTTQ